MKDGALACVGSPNDLKQQYGCGYDLLVRRTESTNADATRETMKGLVSEKVPGAVSLAHPVPNELRFTLPVQSRHLFGAFFESLESQKADLSVETYGISMAPLEDVFLKVRDSLSNSYKVVS